MSVKLRADELLTQTRGNIDNAAKCLIEFLDPDTSGHDSFQDHYIIEMQEFLVKLLEMKRKLPN
jgi:hypothetical protein